MTYDLRSHTADIAVEATGETLDEAFAAAASGLTATHCEEILEGKTHFSFTVTAESREALLFDYLDELIYQRDVRNVLPTNHSVSVTETDTFTLAASADGVPLEDIEAREIKAVTYSDMELEETESRWRVYVVFDV